MLARAQLSVIAVAALAACASARPDYHSNLNTNKYVPVSRPKEHAVGTLQSTELSNFVNSVTPFSLQIQTILRDDNFDTNENLTPYSETGNAGSVPDTPSPTEKPAPPATTTAPPEPTTLPPRFRDDSTPVNLRYPHAVLFGGTCGGSIIHPKWILTAGHCTLFTGGRYVLAGTNNSDDGSGITKKVKKLHIHPLFSVGPYWLNAKDYGIAQVGARWDFLLAELEEPLTLDNVKIASVPLEDQLDLESDTYVGYAGYGTEHHGGFMRSEMHAMNLKLQNNSTCSKLEQFNDEDMICARGYAPRNDSACNGDSGSGLVSSSGKLVGVASWVENDAYECRNGNIVVFSKVARVRDWIQRVAGI